MKKIVLFVCISPLVNTVHAHWLSFLLPVSTQLQKLTEQDTQKAWNKRMLIGFCGGFCANAFCQDIATANIIGIPITAASAYSLNKYASIIIQERQWLDITNAYVIGALAGRLARMGCYKAKQKLNKLFNKPEARVVITQRAQN
jgi:hypothetical protein